MVKICKVVNTSFNLGKALCEIASLYLTSMSSTLGHQILKGSHVRINVLL